MEHDKGREFVKGMEEAALQALSGKEGYEERIAENARGYLELLREHISREDTILYPLAERVMKEELRDEILEGYRQAGLRTPELEERYRALVEQYERSA
jgi:hemerythrin-like domain-containing protein